jgi:uncharacterized protein involved in type VI secretion and phage assembly
MPDATKYYGKFRGTVTNNTDPLQTGRIQVQVPDVLTVTPSSWAMPCFPFTGIQAGMYCVPPVGAGVWVEFEGGDPNYPVYVGGWWGSAGEIPALALAGTPGMPNFLVSTTGQQTFLMSDTPGGPGITLKSRSGAMIVINDTGILITTGAGATILLAGNSVTVNEGALTVI